MALIVPHHAADKPSKAPEGSHQDSGSNNGFSVVAHALAKLGIKHMYGVVGIPVTELASAAQVHHLLLTPPPAMFVTCCMSMPAMYVICCMSSLHACCLLTCELW